MAFKEKKRRGPKFTFGDAEIDLVPMIDCIFLILLFFMLCGRITIDQRSSQITVPPTKTANKFKDKEGWTRTIINVYGSTKYGDPPRNTIELPARHQKWNSQGVNDYSGYQGLRAALDQIYDKAGKYDDPKKSGMLLPKVVVEIRADADTEYRVVEEIQQVLSDTMDLTNMQPKKGVNIKDARPFVNVDFTARKPGDR
jgi:biopolymer transport protein ExbD